jgi:hypothetical protein
VWGLSLAQSLPCLGQVPRSRSGRKSSRPAPGVAKVISDEPQVVAAAGPAQIHKGVLSVVDRARGGVLQFEAESTPTRSDRGIGVANPEFKAGLT